MSLFCIVTQNACNTWTTQEFLVFTLDTDPRSIECEHSIFWHCLSFQLAVLPAAGNWPLETLQRKQQKPWALSLKWVVLTWLSTSSHVPFDVSQNKIMPSSSPKVLLSRGWMLYWFYLVFIMITYGLIRTNVYRVRKRLLLGLTQDHADVQCSQNTKDDTAGSSVGASGRRQ